MADLRWAPISFNHYVGRPRLTMADCIEFCRAHAECKQANYNEGGDGGSCDLYKKWGTPTPGNPATLKHSVMNANFSELLAR
jgi:hypothetical protein